MEAACRGIETYINGSHGIGEEFAHRLFVAYLGNEAAPFQRIENVHFNMFPVGAVVGDSGRHNAVSVTSKLCY